MNVVISKKNSGISSVQLRHLVVIQRFLKQFPDFFVTILVSDIFFSKLCYKPFLIYGRAAFLFAHPVQVTCQEIQCMFALLVKTTVTTITRHLVEHMLRNKTVSAIRNKCIRTLFWEIVQPLLVNCFCELQRSFTNHSNDGRITLSYNNSLTFLYTICVL